MKESGYSISFVWINISVRQNAVRTSRTFTIICGNLIRFDFCGNIAQTFTISGPD